MTLPYPVDAPGYIDFPGTQGNYARFNRAELSSLTTIQFTVRVRFDTLGTYAALATWNNGQAKLSMGSTPLRPMITVINTSAGAIGGGEATVDIPGLNTGMDVWIKAKLTIADAHCTYWYSLEDVDDLASVTWVPLGATVTGLNPGTTPRLDGSVATNLGNFLTANLFNGRMYYFSEEDNGVEALRFDGTNDLAGIPPDAASLKPSVGPTGTLLSFTRRAVAASQGYLRLYGNPGNYATVPDSASVDIANNLAMIMRVRAVDMSPANVGIAMASKAQSADQYSFALTVNTTGEVGFTVSANGTTLVPLSAAFSSQSGQWYWLSLRFSGTRLKMWVSSLESLVPPQASDWMMFADLPLSSTTIFAGTSPLTIGALTPTGLTFEGDIGYFSYGTRVTDDPLTMASLVVQLTADNFIGLPPDIATITPSTGPVITIVRTPTPKGSGFLELPGTVGNCLSIPDSASLDLTGTFVIAARVTPRNPLPLTITEQTIISKWGLAGHRSYALQIDINGKVVLLYSPDGTASTFLRSSQVLSFREPQWLLASSWYAGGVRSVRFWRSTDRRTWSEVGTVQQATTADIFASDSPVIIGASFLGRISGAFINLGGTDGLPTGVTEVLRMDSEHLAIDPAATSFPIVGGLATVVRTPTPVDFGYIDFPGTTGNYLTVPDAANLRLTNNFCVSCRITPADSTPRDTDRILIRKWAASPNMGWQLLLSTRGTLKFVYSLNGTTFTVAESPSLGLDNYYAKRVVFSYSTSLGGQFWTSDDNVYWTRLGTPFALSGPCFASTAQVEIGHTFPGAISEASIRTPLAADGSPAMGSSVLLINMTCLHIDPAATSFVATTGQTVTVFRDDVSIVQGNVRFTGSAGNFLETPDHASLDIGGPIGFLFRLAPDQWKPKTAQSFISKWDDGSVANANYLVRLSPNGTFLFSFTSLDGLTDVTMESPPVTDTVDGEFRFMAMTIDMAATKTLRLFETHNMGDTWVQVGANVTETAGDATMKTGTSPLIIGAQNLDVGHFSGRLSYLDIRNGNGAGGVPGGVSAFLMDAEALHILVTDNTFTDHTGKVVTLHQADTPVEPGWISFGGVTGEYAHAVVPSFTTTDDFSIVARLSLAVPDGAASTDEQQVVLEKWVAPNASFSLRRVSDTFTLNVSVDGATSTFQSTSPEWPVDPSDATASKWGWLGVTCVFDSGQAAVSWFYVADEVTPYGTPLFPDDWPLWGVARSYNGASMYNLAAQPITLGSSALPFHGSISDLYLLAGTAAGGAPGGSAHFVFDLESFFGIASDSGAFTAVTGQNVVLEPLSVVRTMHIEPTPTGPVLVVTPSPPGPTTEIIPAPSGPVLVIQPASAGPTAEVVASDQGPWLSLFSPSLDRPWWPGSTNPDPSTWWTQPAFTVQRPVRGDITGGDYVRGSTNVTTEQTALRFLTRLAGWTPAGIGKGLLYAVPYWQRDPYHTVEIEWNLPSELLRDFERWSEVVIVRSAMGVPLTVNDGQTIFRAAKLDVFPLGDYRIDEDGNVITRNVYDPYPYDPTGGQPGLPSGRWYYYSLFFRMGTEWARSATTYTLLPRNFGHTEYLWESIPPYYRWLDDQQQSTIEGGDLARFLKIFGYELDFTRELVESWQDVYHTDFTPMQLLRRVGDNFGVPHEPGIGDPCYRALVARIGTLYSGRGTTGALRSMVAATAKCDCDITQGENMLLLPDDSDFYSGTGNWAGLNPLTTLSGAGIPTNPLTPDKIFVEHGIYNRPAPETGRGSMHVWTAKADATRNLIICCGDGILYYFDNHGTTNPHEYTWLPVSTAPPKTFLPRFTATLVQEDSVIGFSVSVRTDIAGVTAMPMLIWFPETGMPADDYSTVELAATPSVLASDVWVDLTVSGPVPDDAQYCVPAVAFSTRPAGSDPDLSPMIHFDGASVYVLGSTEKVSSTDIDRYLTLGVDHEKIGPPNTGTGFPGYLLGDQLT